MDFVVVTFTTGALFCVFRDWKVSKLDKHLFYYTRLSYYLMLYWIVQSYFAPRYSETLLNIAAPISMNVYISYFYGQLSDFDETLSAENFVSHFMMPLFSMFVWYENVSYLPWYFFLWILVPMSFHILQEYLYVKLFHKNLYSFTLLSWKGVGGIAGMFVPAMLLCILKSFMAEWYLPYWLPLLIGTLMAIGMIIDMWVDHIRLQKTQV